jgi:cytochrome c-type biogenesis protein CcmH
MVDRMDGLRILRPLALLALVTAQLFGQARAGEAAPASDDPARQARVMAIAAELRCLVCQNQTIADSHAGLAEDLRRQIREMLDKGMSERQILDFMTERYGDFVLYRPPVKSTTLLLWAGPALLMAGGVVALLLVLRRRQRMAPDAFEPDTDDDPNEPAR